MITDQLKLCSLKERTTTTICWND